VLLARVDPVLANRRNTQRPQRRVSDPLDPEVFAIPAGMLSSERNAANRSVLRLAL
jgi:hypothetical protein